MKPNNSHHNRSLRNISTKQNSFNFTQLGFNNDTTKLKTQHSVRYAKSLAKDIGFMVTKKAKIYSKDQLKQKQVQVLKPKDPSNFQRLKYQAKCLQGQHPLGKGRNQIDQPLGYVVNKQFISLKKLSMIQRYRQNIKKINKKKTLSSFLNINGLSDVNFRPSYSIKQEHRQTVTTAFPKKETPTIVKNYYRPHSVRPTISSSKQLKNQIHGRSITKQYSKNDDIVIICL